VQRAEPVKTEQHHHASARDIPRRLLLLAPTVCAAIVIALILIRVPAAGSWTGAAAPTPASAAPSGDVTAAAPTQPAPVTPPQPAVATTTYIVRPGDSLWKIFTSMRAQSGDRKGWMDFLSNAQSMNALGDPDRLQPGKVLTFSGHE
jgi:nucleoid-associated protein YgaU